jgi:hypothetical protein
MDLWVLIDTFFPKNKGAYISMQPLIYPHQYFFPQDKEEIIGMQAFDLPPPPSPCQESHRRHMYCFSIINIKFL